MLELVHNEVNDIVPVDTVLYSSLFDTQLPGHLAHKSNSLPHDDAEVMKQEDESHPKECSAHHMHV
eukprot:COSAG01_NODE_45331_length_410_cov_0.993569_2_plen_65_part_01